MPARAAAGLFTSPAAQSPQVVDANFMVQGMADVGALLVDIIGQAFAAISREPMTTASMLLKSWAMPPMR